MNKLFTKIAGLCVGLAMAIGVGVGVSPHKVGEVIASSQVWQLVTSEPSDWSGQYILCNGTSGTVKYLDGSTFTSGSASGSDVTVNDGKITADDADALTIAKSSTSGKYTIKINGKFVGRNATSNGFDASDTWTVNYDNDISYSSSKVTIAGNGGRTLTWYANNSNFKYYASSNNCSQLYKKVENKTLSSIAVKTAPTKTKYLSGESFDASGLVITATYSDASTEDISYDDHADDFDFDISTVTASGDVTITYGEKTCTQAISLVTLSKIELSGSFVNDQFVGQDWDPDGVVATATYSDGGTSPISLNDEGLSLTFDPSNPALGTTKVNISISFGGKTASKDYDVTVKTAPTKVTFDAISENYENSETVTEWKNSDEKVIIRFSDGKYYTSGTAIRAYAGSTITVTTITGYYVTKVDFAFGSDDNNTITSDVGTFSSPTWTGVEQQGVVFTIGGTKGHRRIQAMDIYYEQGEVHYPVSVSASFASGKGSYFNGSNANSKMNFGDVVGTFTLDNGKTQNAEIDEVKIYEGSTLKATLTSSSQPYSFKDVNTSSSWTLVIACEGVTESGEDLISDSLVINLIKVECTKYEWKDSDPAPTTIFYSHLDEFEFGGNLYATFSDGSHASQSAVYGHTRVDIIHEGSKTGTVIENIPTHEDGTINVTEPKTYWVESYFEENKTEADHLFTEVSVELPTIEVSNGDLAGTKYYTGVGYTANPSIVVKKGDDVVDGLSADDFVISPEEFTPSTTDPITITVSLAKDSAISDSYEINPEVSQRVLTDLTILDVEFHAGDKFVLGDEDILLSYTEGTALTEYLNSADVVFKHEDDVLDAETYLLKSMDGWEISATYSEGNGEGKTVTTTFVISVGSKIIEDYTPGVRGDFEKVTSAENLSGKYLIVATYLKEGDANNGKTFIYNSTTGSDGSQTSTVSIVDNKISKDTIVNELSIENLAFEIKATQDGYSIKNNAATASYITGKTTNDNGTIFSKDEVSVSITAQSDGTFEIAGNGKYFQMNLNIQNGNPSPLFRFYKETNRNAYVKVNLYKQVSTSDDGNPVQYLMDVIDYFRLESETVVGNEGFTVCGTDAKSGIYNYSDWEKVKATFKSLTLAQKEELDIQDTFGEAGYTYLDTLARLIGEESSARGRHNFGILSDIIDSKSSTAIVIIISACAITTLGGYFLLKKKKED